mmetsp:Transcript_17550/g.29614  ORF Transcript_17550/g.29614 Transcript_17550/m.29614 type:complete len:205 (-) Transcript_17550:212-826(-)
MVVESGGGGAAAADGVVGLHSAAEVLLLAVVPEETLELALALPGLHVPHHVLVRLARDLGGPPHDVDLLVVLDHARLAQHVVEQSGVDLHVGAGLLEELVLGRHGGQSRVAVDAQVEVDGGGLEVLEEVREGVGEVDLVDEVVLLLVLVRGQQGHPDLVVVVQLRHEQDRLLPLEVDHAVAVHLAHSEEVVEEGFLVLGVAHIT